MYKQRPRNAIPINKACTLEQSYHLMTLSVSPARGGKYVLMSSM